MLKNRDFKFDKRTSFYDAGFEGKFPQRFYKLLLDQIEPVNGMTVLDAGCGTGVVLKAMSGICEIEGYGIDIEEKMLAEAKAKCPGMSIILSGCVETPFENCKLYVITSCMAYHHFDDQNGFAKEAARIIKSGGRLFIADPRFPLIVRKPLNIALRLHKISGHFGTAKEISLVFEKYGFTLADVKFNKYAQCVKLIKTA